MKHRNLAESLHENTPKIEQAHSIVQSTTF